VNLYRGIYISPYSFMKWIRMLLDWLQYPMMPTLPSLQSRTHCSLCRCDWGCSSEDAEYVGISPMDVINNYLERSDLEIEGFHRYPRLQFFIMYLSSQIFCVCF
jgi:hypothetical protein